MSDFHAPDADAHIPRFEPWLAVLCAAFVPAVLVVYTPDAFHIPLIALTSVLVVAGLSMLAAHTRRISEGRHRVEGAES